MWLWSLNAISLSRKKKKKILHYAQKSPPTAKASVKVEPQSLVLTCAGLAKYAPAVITPHRAFCAAFKMGFILLTFTGTSLTFNFPPVTYVYTVQMQQKEKKNQNPILRSETSLTENKAPVSDKLQQCRKKFTQEGLLSGSLGQWKRPQSKMEVVSGT